MYKNQNINALENIEQNENNVFLDVRTPTEYSEGHIEGSINIDVMSENFTKKLESLNKDNNYFVICRSGGRSESACSAMVSAGYGNLTNMEGGMMSWMGKTKSL